MCPTARLQLWRRLRGPCHKGFKRRAFSRYHTRSTEDLRSGMAGRDLEAGTLPTDEGSLTHLEKVRDTFSE